jgi:hypothetical protein
MDEQFAAWECRAARVLLESGARFIVLLPAFSRRTGELKLTAAR